MSRPDRARSQRAVFRLPGISLVFPFLLFICVTPLATAGATAFLVLYLLPVLGLVYILITRTVADASVIRTTGLFGGRRIAWSDLDGFEFRGPRWAVAVTQNGRRVRLPMVRPRDLPRLALVSGGRLLLGKDAPAPVDPEPPVDLEPTAVPDRPEAAEPPVGQEPAAPAEVESEQPPASATTEGSARATTHGE